MIIVYILLILFGFIIISFTINFYNTYMFNHKNEYLKKIIVPDNTHPKRATRSSTQYIDSKIYENENNNNINNLKIPNQVNEYSKEIKIYAEDKVEKEFKDSNEDPIKENEGGILKRIFFHPEEF